MPKLCNDTSLLLFWMGRWVAGWVGGWVAGGNGNKANLSPAEAGAGLSLAINSG